MSEAISDKAMQQATGEPWHTWLDRLNAMDAQNLSHTEIATKLVETYNVSGWWAQSLTVRYEQKIGRRRVGQSSDGKFSVSVSKTISGTMDDAMGWWRKKVRQSTEFNHVPIVTSSHTDTTKWRYYRAALKDGSRVVVTIYEKTPTKASLGLQHEKLTTTQAVESWRAYWKTFLDK
ncbi:MAG TPA: hypothetical protein VFM68_00170 [Candidatus Saccharimonadales bacterium]|nr:hypothetical protein [Candidatus Saccharimonadales bacterium]